MRLFITYLWHDNITRRLILKIIGRINLTAYDGTVVTFIIVGDVIV